MIDIKQLIQKTKEEKTIIEEKITINFNMLDKGYYRIHDDIHEIHFVKTGSVNKQSYYIVISGFVSKINSNNFEKTSRRLTNEYFEKLIIEEIDLRNIKIEKF